MCPDPQILSIYVDGELPSPWKEKMESHLAGCPACREKLESLQSLREAFKHTKHQERTIVDLAERPQAESILSEQELLERAKDKIWRKLETRQRFRYRTAVWQRRLSIPLPAAAAAAVILLLFAAIWMRGLPNSNSISEPSSFMLAAEEDMQGIIPIADMNSVLQYLGSSDTNIIIFQLPESQNFFRSGEPAIIRAADYPGRRP